jgi:hypothetical protein
MSDKPEGERPYSERPAARPVNNPPRSNPAPTPPSQASGAPASGSQAGPQSNPDRATTGGKSASPLLPVTPRIPVKLPTPATTRVTVGVTPRAKPGLGTGCLIIVGLAVLIIAIFWIVGATAGPDQSDTAAEVACQDQVQQELKAPDSAHFDAPTDTGSAPNWTIQGTVTSENSFGAQLPATYECKVHFVGSTAQTTVEYVNQN